MEYAPTIMSLQNLATVFVAVPIIHGIRSYRDVIRIKQEAGVSQSPSFMEYAPTKDKHQSRPSYSVAVPIIHGIRSYLLLALLLVYAALSQSPSFMEYAPTVRDSGDALHFSRSPHHSWNTLLLQTST